MEFPHYRSVTLLILLMFQGIVRTQEVVTTETALDVIRHIYNECIQEGSLTCLRPRLISFLKKSLSQEKIRITGDLSIIPREGAISTSDFNQEIDGSKTLRTIERLDNFVGTHDLRIRLPRELFTGELLNYVPHFLLKNIPEEIRVPLASPAPVEQGRGFVRKILLPFLLGLKFKATALLPLALGLIALKTWKALTLGLLSMVLSGAMIIFKFSKPKLNYEIIHYAHHPHPIVEHASYDHHHHSYGRSLPYRGYPQPEKS